MTLPQIIATRWLALWNGDIAALNDVVAESVITHAILVGQVAEVPMVGRRALGGWIAQMHAATPGLRFSIEVGPLVDGDLIALRWRVQGDQNNAPLSFTGTDILRVERDRIIEYWVNSDTLLMMAQMEAAKSLA